MKWTDKLNSFENDILDELNSYFLKYKSFDLPKETFYYDDYEISSVDVEELDLFGPLWFINYGEDYSTLFAGIEDISLKCEIMDYIKGNYENI